MTTEHIIVNQYVCITPTDTDLSVERDSMRVVYNKVPKCGSSVVQSVMRPLRKTNTTLSFHGEFRPLGNKSFDEQVSNVY